eukprot:3940396-Rhodomonas_salina.1
MFWRGEQNLGLLWPHAFANASTPMSCRMEELLLLPGCVIPRHILEHKWVSVWLYLFVKWEKEQRVDSDVFNQDVLDANELGECTWEPFVALPFEAVFQTFDCVLDAEIFLKTVLKGSKQICRPHALQPSQVSKGGVSWRGVRGAGLASEGGKSLALLAVVATEAASVEAKPETLKEVPWEQAERKRLEAAEVARAKAAVAVFRNAEDVRKQAAAQSREDALMAASGGGGGAAGEVEAVAEAKVEAESERLRLWAEAKVGAEAEAEAKAGAEAEAETEGSEVAAAESTLQAALLSLGGGWRELPAVPLFNSGGTGEVAAQSIPWSPSGVSGVESWGGVGG